MANTNKGAGVQTGRVLTNAGNQFSQLQSGKVRIWSDAFTAASATITTTGDYIQCAVLSRKAVLIHDMCEITPGAGLGAGATAAKFGQIISTTTGNYLNSTINLSGTANYACTTDSAANRRKQLWELLGYTTEANCPINVPLSLRFNGSLGTDALVNVQLAYVME